LYFEKLLNVFLNSHLYVKMLLCVLQYYYYRCWQRRRRGGREGR